MTIVLSSYSGIQSVYVYDISDRKREREACFSAQMNRRCLHDYLQHNTPQTTNARETERDLSISLVRSCLRRVSVTRKRVQSVATVAA